MRPSCHLDKKDKTVEYLVKLLVYLMLPRLLSPWNWKGSVMPVIRSNEAVVYELQGVRFASYASSAAGSKELCVWRTEVSDVGTGVPHRVSREEVFVIIEGRVHLMLDDEMHTLGVGDVALVRAGTLLRLDNLGPGPAAMWVSTSCGLEAELADGTRMSPPWAA
jgi:mannose-6-phosphate isomerase-like protein (cupin superfamily)